jgi:hypothetical protein
MPDAFTNAAAQLRGESAVHCPALLRGVQESSMEARRCVGPSSNQFAFLARVAM